MDLDDITDELYQLHPARFIAARDEHARAARRSGNAPLARAITALRRPAVSAWVINRYARTSPGDVDQLRELGEQLRAAYTGGTTEQVRELTGRQHTLAARCARQARELAENAGQPVSATVQREVEETLYAALADPQAAQALAAARLERPLRPAVGFGALPGPPRRPEPGRPLRKKSPLPLRVSRQRAKRTKNARANSAGCERKRTRPARPRTRQRMRPPHAGKPPRSSASASRRPRRPSSTPGNNSAPRNAGSARPRRPSKTPTEPELGEQQLGPGNPVPGRVIDGGRASRRSSAGRLLSRS